MSDPLKSISSPPKKVLIIINRGVRGKRPREKKKRTKYSTEPILINRIASRTKDEFKLILFIFCFLKTCTG